MYIISLMERFVDETVGLFVEMSPYLLMGFFFAGLLHVWMGERYIRKHFSGSGWLSVIKAALFGVPLPVCSCGVIPLAESLRRDGASKSATMSFLVSTPSSGVDSIMATYALMGPVMAVFRPVASFLSGVLVGILTHWQELREIQGLGASGAGVDGVSASVSPPAAKVKKKAWPALKEIFLYGFRVIPGEIAKWLLLGVIIGGAISAFLPPDFGVRYLGSPFLNYLVILMISIPLYVCATGSIPIAASLLAKGVLPGAALAFLIAGPATNTVTISFIYKRMGARITGIYIFSIVVTAVASGLIFDAVWKKMGVDSAALIMGSGHNHAFHLFKYGCAVLLALIFLTGKFDTGKLMAILQKKRGSSMTQQITINVPDMNCQHCKMKISQALGATPEIESHSIDLSTRSVTVQTQAERRFVLERIIAEGYHPVE